MRFNDVVNNDNSISAFDCFENYLKADFDAKIIEYDINRLYHDSEMIAIEAYKNGGSLALEAHTEIILEGFVSKAWGKIKEWAKKLWEGIKSLIKYIRKNMIKVWNYVKSKIKSITSESMIVTEDYSDEEYVFDYDILKFASNVNGIIKVHSAVSEKELLNIAKESESTEEVKNKIIDMISKNIFKGRNVSNTDEINKTLKDFLYAGVDDKAFISKDKWDNIQKSMLRCITDIESDVDEFEKAFVNFEKMYNLMYTQVKKTAGDSISEYKINLFIIGSKSVFELVAKILKDILNEMNTMFMKFAKDCVRFTKPVKVSKPKE